MAAASESRKLLVLRITSAVGAIWTGYIICLPYIRWQQERYQGPPPITTGSSVSPSLINSDTVTRIINPGNQPYKGDTRSVTFSILRDRQSGKVLSDAEILKRLCLGFWGGSVFSYEKALLRTWKKDWVCFDDQLPRGKDRGDMFATFRPGRMDFVLEKGDTLDRAFQVLDIKVNPATAADPSAPSDPAQPSSYIDFGFGSSQPGSKFAGVHRLSVTRLPPEQIQASGWSEQLQKEWLEDSGGRVTITHESYVCSPSPAGNWLLRNSWLQDFHERYAYGLFSLGVGYVVRGWGRSKGS
ncbi:hypothetical protein DV735_g1471, partial [Chaetothyriales sp. CBS 134920]